jgi:N-acetylneuraminate lyase
MTTEERKLVTEIVKDEVKDRARIICHVGGAVNTAEAVKLAKHAAKVKVDAIAAIPPFYYPYSFAEIYRYYETVAAEGGLPMFFYYLPKFTGAGMTAAKIAEFAKIPNIVGIKYTEYDMYTLRELLAIVKEKWVAFSGWDDMFLSALTMGIDGSIGSTQNCLPEIFTGIYRNYVNGNIKEAERLQKRVVAAITITGKFGGIISRKAVLKFRGIDAGFSKAPLKQKLSRDEEKWLHKEWKKYFPDYC